MTSQRVKLAGEIGGLAALGVGGADELFEPDRLLAGRSEVLERSEHCLRLCFPLPGTPDAGGRLTGRPAGSGTGWAVLSLWRAAPLGASLRARLTAPRSASLAERVWNLLCHLRSRGVGTPEPLAVGARGEGLVARDSFLVTRGLEGAVALPRWLAVELAEPGRARGLEALAHALANLVHSGTVLPRLSPGDVALIPGPEGGCELATGDGAGLRLNRLPGVVITQVPGGRLGLASRAARVLRGLLGELEREGLLTGGERARILSSIETGVRAGTPSLPSGARLGVGPRETT